jgi:hypothetical protein
MSRAQVRLKLVSQINVELLHPPVLSEQLDRASRFVDHCTSKPGPRVSGGLSFVIVWVSVND